ncbi:MAG TPA: HAD family phosphatase [Candidatus Blautia intestinigallinarum]|nr:HAD family phosphatase [Candidatus Blautia intestinigallinarum]
MSVQIKHCSFAIFDMDGTLLDSMGKWQNLGREYLSVLGIHPPEDLEERLAMMSMRESAEYFHRDLGVPGDWKKIVKDLNQMMEDAYRNTLLLKPGAENYLEFLKGCGTKLCVLTATPSYLAEMAFERLGVRGYFEFIMDCEMAGSGKTQPGCYYQAAARLGGGPSQTAVYEDADFALKTASDAGFYTIGIYDETMKAQRDYLASICDVYVSTYSDLLQDSKRENYDEKGQGMVMYEF